MSRRTNPPLPHRPFGLLIVEGGDERSLCEAVAGPSVWSGLFCWTASGRNDIRNLALLARLDPGFIHARSVGLVLDTCVDALVQCAQPRYPTTALAAKGWLNAYLAMLPEQQRIHQAFDPVRGGLDASHPAFHPLSDFLRGL